MMMFPGSHRGGRRVHRRGTDGTNVLDNDQYVDAVDDTDAVLCPLRPGEASFHHGWTLHSSRPNQSGDRRIGLNIQYPPRSATTNKITSGEQSLRSPSATQGCPNNWATSSAPRPPKVGSTSIGADTAPGQRAQPSPPRQSH